MDRSNRRCIGIVASAVNARTKPPAPQYVSCLPCPSPIDGLGELGKIGASTGGPVATSAISSDWQIGSTAPYVISFLP